MRLERLNKLFCTIALFTSEMEVVNLQIKTSCPQGHELKIKHNVLPTPRHGASEWRTKGSITSTQKPARLVKMGWVLGVVPVFSESKCYSPNQFCLFWSLVLSCVLASFAFIIIIIIFNVDAFANRLIFFLIPFLDYCFICLLILFIQFSSNCTVCYLASGNTGY